MASSESVHAKLGRVRTDRVHLKYEVHTGSATEERELPFVVGVLGDFSGNPTTKLKPLKERNFTDINRDNFDDVMEKMTPGVNLKVANTLKGDGSEMSVQLKFSKIDDFSPAEVVRQVPALNKLLETRDKLRDLLAKVDHSEDLEKLLEQVLKNTDQIKKLATELSSQAPGATKE